MGRNKPNVAGERAAEQGMRDQEVLRANRELAAYFKGRRTEREARGALKVIKAFVRDRQRLDAKNRPPLPGALATKVLPPSSRPKAASGSGEQQRRKRRRKPHATLAPGPIAPVEPSANTDPSHDKP